MSASLGATVEQRLEAVEHTVKQLRHDLTATEAALKDDVARVRDDVRRENQERAASVHDLTQQIEDVASGGLDLES